MMQKIDIWLDGKAVGKARPRFGSYGNIHTASGYGEWKSNAILNLKNMGIQQITIPVKVTITCCNFFSSDIDNLQGSILDALVQANILQNDSSSYVNASGGRFVKVRKKRNQPKVKGVMVRIEPQKIETIEVDELFGCIGFEDAIAA